MSVPRLLLGDCLQLMKGIEDASVDLVATDPPYFRVKEAAWDRQWSDAEAFLAWLGECVDQWRRVLRPSGSLYVFASPQMASRVEEVVRERMAVLNHIVWTKANEQGFGPWNRAHKEGLRAFFPQTERIIFAEQAGGDAETRLQSAYVAKCDELRATVYEPIRAYLSSEWERAGLTRDDANEATGTKMAGHWFSSSQWALPTAEQYAKLQARANGLKPWAEIQREHTLLSRDYQYLRRQFEDLKREYDELRRPFFVSSGVPYTDVWTFPTVAAYTGKHPCEKPLALMDHIVAVSSRPGDVVLDSFMGSGVTGLAALRAGRQFVGIEKDPAWFEVARERLADAKFPRRRPVKEAHALPLFDVSPLTHSPEPGEDPEDN